MHANSSVFLVAQREMDEEEPALHDLYAYGVIAEIKQVLRVSDDLVKVLVEGKTRARLLELDAGEKYLPGCGTPRGGAAASLPTSATRSRGRPKERYTHGRRKEHSSV